MREVPCPASKWADEEADAIDRYAAAREDAEAELCADSVVADAIAGEIAEEEQIDTEGWTQTQWDEFVSERWEDIVDRYMEQ